MAAAAVVALGTVDATVDRQQPSTAVPGPVIPGLHADHPLDARGIGKVLIAELACAWCHPDLPASNPGPKQPPDLREVGARVAPAFLRKFIAQPSTLVPGTTMPHLLDGLPVEERTLIAEAITQFLASIATEPFHRDPLADDAIAKGEELFHTVGCVVCHDARRPAGPTFAKPQPRPGTVSLAYLPEKTRRSALANFLHDPLVIRPSGRMPDLSLSRAEAEAIASYLLAAQTLQVEQAAHDFPLAEDGRLAFQKFRCGSCHPLEGTPPPASIPLGTAPNRVAGCLSPQPGHAPNFHLTSGQRTAILIALTPDPVEDSAAQSLDRSLVTFHCYGCHTRNGRGGIEESVRPYFGTDEPALGDPARLPPPLTEIGAKLNREWLSKVLFNRERVRPYMHTRMPQYGDANLAALPQQFAAADPAPPIEIPVFRGKRRGEVHEAARNLVGSDMLACISCHSFNGKASPGMNGLDLTTTAERLQPAWFKAFLLDPLAHRPGIIMPSFWPGGVAQRQDVLDGNTDLQIDAIWSYLEQGRTARDPKGIRSEPTLLSVTDRPRLYRGRSRVAGFRGIAVGFPGGWNYAFNAETGALSSLWQGDFVRVSWDNQGAGDFSPREPAVQLAKDLAFMVLQAPEQAWPLLPVMTEEEPVNPDPLYPKRLGYRFRGYHLDADGVPTLLYSSGSVEIEDTIRPAQDAANTLLRELRFQQPRAQLLHFRALTGAIKSSTSGRFSTDSLTLTLPADCGTLLRDTPDGHQELILILDLAASPSTLELRYALR